MSKQRESVEQQIQNLCEQSGYGYVMWFAERLWEKKNPEALTIGPRVEFPHVASTRDELKPIIEYLRSCADGNRKVYGAHHNVELFEKWANRIESLANRETPQDGSRPTEGRVSINSAITLLDSTLRALSCKCEFKEEWFCDRCSDINRLAVLRHHLTSTHTPKEVGENSGNGAYD